MSILEIVKLRKNPVVLDKQDKFIFFPNNKVCQRSIVRVTLKDRAIVKKDNEDLWTGKINSFDEDYMENIFKFSFVRNPYDRALSAFTYLQKNMIIDKKYNFKLFCEEILLNKGIQFDPHFDMQSDGLFVGERLLVDFLGRFENLHDDWEFVSEKIGDQSLQLAHINKSPRKKDYTSYYDKNTCRIIGKIYHEDIRNFGYFFEQKKHVGLFHKIKLFINELRKKSIKRV